MNMKKTRLAVVCALVTACTSVPSEYSSASQHWNQTTQFAQGAMAPPILAEGAGLDDYVQFALRNNAALIAAAQRWKAALERVPQVGSLPDPRLNLGWFVNEVETRTGPMDWRLAISQVFPWFGKLDLAERIALEQASAARETYENERLRVVQQVRDTWFEYAYIETAVDVTRGHRDLLMSWEEIARSRYATGLGIESDVIRAQVELGKLDDQLRTLEDLRRPIVARLNATLNRPASTPVAPPTLPELPRRDLDESKLSAGLLETSPHLRALEFDRAAAKLAIELADKQFYPDLSLGLDYTAIGSARGSGISGSGDDALAIVPGFTIPIRRRRYEAGVAQARAELSGATAAWREATNRIAAELELGLYHVRDAQRRIGLFRDTLVAKGRESVESISVAYQTGAAGFLDWIDAERVLLEFQLAAARAQADHAQAVAAVELLTGVPVFTQEP